MGAIDLLIGREVGQRIVVVGTVVVYVVLAAVDPTKASDSAVGGLVRFGHLFTLIFASLLLASGVGTVLPDDAITDRLGEAPSVSNVAGAGLLVGLFPGGPYAVYPVIESIAERGAGDPAVLTMLLGYGLVGAGRIAFGLVFFTPWIVGMRLGLAVGGTLIVAGVTVGLVSIRTQY